MNLLLFRSLLARDQRLMSQIASLATRSEFDGVSVNFSNEQLTSTLDTVLRACNDHSYRFLCELTPQSSSDAGRMLDTLSSRLSKGNSLDLVVLNAPESYDLEDTLSYLREVLPLTAQFLESHPTVGGTYGRVNAHGNLLNNHVVGACHRLPFDIPQLAQLLDVFLPTRLALGREHVLNDVPPDDLEAVVQNTDLLCIHDDAHQALWDEVWLAQRLDEAEETYVQLGKHKFSVEDNDDKAHQLACQMRRRFSESTQEEGS